MTLSSLFQKPAQSAYFTANTTGQVITSSPAIVYGVYVNGPNATPVIITITSGSNVVSKVVGSHSIYGANAWSSYHVANGIDCDSGITVDIENLTPGPTAFAGFHYILK